MKKKVAIVVQRYGVEVVGGAEGLAREVAENMRDHWQITVITTCAKDYRTWKNEYPAGETVVNGVTVQRFSTARERDFAAYSQKAPVTENQAFRISAEEELAHFKDQGPECPELVAHLEKSYDKFDVFLFFTYLYYPTAVGITKVIDKAYLVSTAHDEPPFYFVRTYAPLFHSLKGIVYLSEEEQELINRVYRVPTNVKQIKGGYGVPMPAKISAVEEQQMRAKFSWMNDAPYFIYVGRASRTKCVPNMIDAYAYMTGDYHIATKLVYAGTFEDDLELPPNRSDMIVLGYVTEKEKSFLLRHAVALINPSPLESLSMVVLEAWRHGVPVIVNGESLVMRGLCDRSGGGVYYHSQAMFKGLLAWAYQNAGLGRELGAKGKAYVDQHYGWESSRATLLAEIT